jgi:hypothetical protein
MFYKLLDISYNHKEFTSNHLKIIGYKKELN